MVFHPDIFRKAKEVSIVVVLRGFLASQGDSEFLLHTCSYVTTYGRH